jgi:hypothetical protein
LEETSQTVLNINANQALVAHAYNPNYFRRQRSGGSQLEANPGKEFARPYLENAHTEKGWWNGSSGRATV